AFPEPAALPGGARAGAGRSEGPPRGRGTRVRRMTAPVILSIEAYGYLAAELAARCGGVAGEIERGTFPDGERHLRVISEVNDRDVVLVGGTVSDAATLELYDLACAIVENGAATLTLIVPWFGYSTAERAGAPGEAVVAKTRARLLSSIPAAKLGNS